MERASLMDRGAIDLILAHQGNLEHFLINRGPKDPPRGNTEPAAQLPRAEEGSMYKSLIAVAGALAILSAGSPTTDRAEASASARRLTVLHRCVPLFQPPPSLAPACAHPPISPP